MLTGPAVLLDCGGSKLTSSSLGTSGLSNLPKILVSWCVCASFGVFFFLFFLPVCVCECMHVCVM